MPLSPRSQSGAASRRSKVTAFLSDSGGLVLLWVLDSVLGHRVATEFVLLFLGADLLRHVVRRIPVPLMWWAVNGSMGVFIIAELVFGTATLEPWEGTATIALFALVFLVGAWMRPPLLQRLFEQAQGAPFPVRPEISRYFRYLTLFWSGLLQVVTLLDICLSVTHFAGEYRSVAETVAPVLAVVAGVAITRRSGRRLFLRLSGKRT
ncbi:hypothetical protein GOB93_08630 [Acetobacter musti]|uniref:Intracellular septation protein A n=1 Tax=Acetobacter musti TaxID=864732 RepID=A0ABX0JRQ7_9PROT|nr:hypothetical protein [Acetobacter musti]NHN84708.1 hypothetical protein [Acetobacter musti]